MDKSNSRLDWVDFAKGLCISLVVVIHHCGLPLIGKLIGAFYMPLFFVVSGYTQRKVSGGITEIRSR